MSDLEEAMRRTSAQGVLYGQAVANVAGISGSDLDCMDFLNLEGRMTAGRLAELTGLTTGAITGVVDRLEEAGYVTRERDPHDRRRVVVKLVVDRAMHDVANLFLPMMRAWREMAARYSDEELRFIVDYYARVEQVLREHLDRLRDAPAG